MARGRARRSEPRFDGLAPLPEQAHAFAETWQIADGKRARAYRRTPVIDTLNLTPRQHAALARYRDICEDRSPFRDSLDKALHGRSNGQGLPPVFLTSKTELEWLDGKLGALVPTVRAIAVRDLTPSQWAMECYGSRISKERRNGWLVSLFKPRRSALLIVQEDITLAATVLADALGY